LDVDETWLGTGSGRHSWALYLQRTSLTLVVDRGSWVLGKNLMLLMLAYFSADGHPLLAKEALPLTVVQEVSYLSKGMLEKPLVAPG
jgi:hypothetical protein